MKKYAGLVFSSLVFTGTFLISGCSFSDIPSALDHVTSSIGGWGNIGIVLTAVMELFMRLVPSVNPRSFLLMFAEVGHALGRFFEGISKFIDGLGLQNLKG